MEEKKMKKFYQNKNSRKELTDFQIGLYKMKADLAREQAKEDIQTYDSMSEDASFGDLLKAKRRKEKAIIFLGNKKR